MSKYCQSCAHQLDLNQNFCPECGEKQTIMEPLQAVKLENIENPPKKPMSFKKKLSLLLIGILGVGLFVGHTMIQSKTSPEVKIQSFLTAMKSENKDEILSQLTISDEIIKNDDSYVNHLLSQNIEGFNTRVIEAARDLSKEGIPQDIQHENGSTLLRLTQQKFLGIYPEYVIEVVPNKVKIITDIENSSFQLEDQTFSLKAGENILGEFLPGTYTGKIIAKNQGYETSRDEEIVLSGLEDYVLTYNKALLTALVSSNEPKAIIYIDEESTGKTVEELSTIGPIFDGEELVVFAEMVDDSGKKNRTSKMDVSGGQIISLMFEREKTVTVSQNDSDEEEEVVEEESDEATSQSESTRTSNKDVQAFFSEYNSLSVLAINEGDFNIVSTLVNPDGPRRKEQSDFVDYLFGKGITEDHIETQVEHIEEINESLWNVTTIESFVIHGTKASSEKKYRTVTTITKVNGNWLVHELISTTEL